MASTPDPTRSIAAVLLAFAAAGVAATPTVCQPPEETVFSCPSGVKRIAVCASGGWDARHGRLQYRFGPAGAVELSVPPAGSASMPLETVTLGRDPYGQAGHGWLRFHSGEYRYTVYSASGGGAGLRSGVVVERSDRRISVRRCDAGRAGEFAPRAFDGRGLVVDPGAFELPD